MTGYALCLVIGAAFGLYLGWLFFSDTKLEQE